MGLDSDFLSSIFHDDKAITKIIENRIKPDYLLNDLVPVFEYIIDFHKSFASVPSLELVEKHFGSFYKEPKEPLLYYINEIKKRQKFRISKTLVEQISTLFSGELEDVSKLEYVDRAEKMILKASRNLLIDLGNPVTVDFVDSAQERIDRYNFIEQHGIGGVPTPWAALNNSIGGWQEKSLNVIIAEPKVGKTWAMCNCILTALKYGHKALVFTEEMSKESMMQRLDAMLFKLDYKKLKHAKLEDKETYFEHLQSLDQLQGRLVINEGAGSAGIDAVEAFSEQENPDIIFIDSFYLYADDYEWKSIADLTKRTKFFANKIGKPVVVTSQEGEKGKAAFSKSFSRDCSVLIRMSPVQDLPLMTFSTLYIRDGEPRNWCTNWDIASHDYDERSDIDPDVEADIS